MGAEQRILRVNQAFSHITRYSQREVQGQTAELWQRHEHGDEYPAGVTAAVRDGRGQ